VEGLLRFRLAMVGVANRERDARKDRAHQRLGIGAERRANVGAVVSQGLRALELFDRLQMNLHPGIHVGDRVFFGEQARAMTLGADRHGWVLAA